MKERLLYIATFITAHKPAFYPMRNNMLVRIEKTNHSSVYINTYSDEDCVAILCYHNVPTLNTRPISTSLQATGKKKNSSLLIPL